MDETSVEAAQFAPPLSTRPGPSEELRRWQGFEELMDSEVGDTNLVRARNLERKFGLRQLYLKFEAGNPTGSQKDRIAFAQVLDALRRGFEGITVATCGNYGCAVALAAKKAGIRAVVYLPEGFHSRRVREMEADGAEVRRAPGSYEEVVDVSRRLAEAEELYDGNPGGGNLPLQLQAYGEIAAEVYDELRDAPVVVALPVSNGTTLAGVHHGFLRLERRGKTSRMPRFVAGSSFRKNPIIQAVRRNQDACEDLDPRKVRETATNEPLINWRSIDGDPALLAIRSTQGWASDFSDKALRQAARTLRECEGLSVLPASTAGLLALLEAHERDPLPPDRYVAVLTGRSP